VSPSGRQRIPSAGKPAASAAAVALLVFAICRAAVESTFNVAEGGV
jgi:hypothetical protein